MQISNTGANSVGMSVVVMVTECLGAIDFDGIVSLGILRGDDVREVSVVVGVEFVYFVPEAFGGAREGDVGAVDEGGTNDFHGFVAIGEPVEVGGVGLAGFKFKGRGKGQNLRGCEWLG